MKSVLKIFGFLLLGLFLLSILAGVAGFFFLKTLEIRKYKPQIIASLTQALGRSVDFQDIRFKISLEKGARLSVTELTVPENPEFGDGNFLTVKKAEIHADPLAFLLARQVALSRIVIDSPRVRVIRSPNGQINLATLGTTQKNAPSQSGSGAALPAIFIKDLRIENAGIVWIDRTGPLETRFNVSELQFELKGFSLTGPFDVLIEGALLAPQKNFRFEGQAQLGTGLSQLRFMESGLTLDLKGIPWNVLRDSPLLSEVPLPQLLDGQLKLRLSDAVVSSKGLENIAGDFFMSNGVVIAPDILPGVSVEAKKIDLGIESFSLGLESPAKVTLKAAIYQDEVNLDASLKVRKDPLGQKFQITEGSIATQLGLWPVNKIKAQVAALKEIPIPEGMSGQVRVGIKELALTPQSLENIVLDIKLQDMAADLKAFLPAGLPADFRKTDLTVNDFALGKQFSVLFKTAYASQTQNLSFEGIVTIGLSEKQPSIEVKNGIAIVELTQFPWEGIRASSLFPENVPLPESVAGRVSAQVLDLKASPLGLERLDAHVKWLSGKVDFPNVAPGISVAAQQINLELQNFGLARPFGFKGSLGYESSEPNIFIDGQVSVDPAGSRITLKDFKTGFALEKIPFEKLKERVEPLKDLVLPAVLKGELEVQLQDAVIDPSGVSALKISGAFKNGEVLLKDVSPGISIALSKINAEVRDYAIGQPFLFDVRAAYLSDEENVFTKGTVDFEQSTGVILLKGSEFGADLSKIGLDRLKRSVLPLKDAPLPSELGGRLNILLEEISAGSTGLISVKGEARLSDWSVQMPQLKVPLRGEHAKIGIETEKLLAEDLTIRAGSGEIVSRVEVSDYLRAPRFDLKSVFKDLRPEELVDQGQTSVEVEGVLSGDMSLKGSGPDINLLQGEGAFEFVDARLLNLNVFRTVIDKIAFLPGLSARIKEKLPEHYAAKWDDDDTVIHKVASRVNLNAGRVTLEPVAIEADEFIFSGTCAAGFDGSYELTGAFKITPELSAVMGDSAEEVQYLFDEQSQVSLPVYVKGLGAAAPAISVTQTALDIGKSAARHQVKKELHRVLEKAIGSESPAEGEAGHDPEGSDDPRSRIIGGILDKFLK